MAKVIYRWDRVLSKIRKELSLSQEDLAHVLGVSSRNIVRWMNGDIENPDKAHLQNIRAIEIILKEAGKALNAEKIALWFRSPNPVLADLRPLDLLGSRTGQDRVIALLGKVRWGIPE